MKPNKSFTPQEIADKIIKAGCTISHNSEQWFGIDGTHKLDPNVLQAYLEKKDEVAPILKRELSK